MGTMEKKVWWASFCPTLTSRVQKLIEKRYSLQVESELQGSGAAEHPRDWHWCGGKVRQEPTFSSVPSMNGT